MQLSIIIPVKDDMRIKDCLASIDEAVETVIVLNNPTRDITDFVKTANAKVIEVPVSSLALAYNAGIEASTNENILLMDSDCTFDPGTIRKLYKGLKDSPLSKGRPTVPGETLISRLIAKNRDYDLGDHDNAYSPPLAFRKDIIDLMGGYYFDLNVPWTEDHEFNQRVQRAGLGISFDPTATILHQDISLKTDLKSAFKYGGGQYEGVNFGRTVPDIIYGGQKGLTRSVLYDVLRTAYSPVLFADVAKKKGLLTAAFKTLVWMPVYNAGYYWQAFTNFLEVEHDR